MEIYIRPTRTWCKVMWKWYMWMNSTFTNCVYVNADFFRMNCLISMKTPIEPPFKHTSYAVRTNNIQIIECKWSVMLSILWRFQWKKKDFASHAFCLKFVMHSYGAIYGCFFNFCICDFGGIAIAFTIHLAHHKKTFK